MNFISNIHLRKIISEYIQYKHSYVDELKINIIYLNDAMNTWIFYKNKSIKQEHSQYGLSNINIGYISRDKHKYEQYKSNNKWVIRVL